MDKYESTRKAYGETLLELIRDGLDIVVLSADTSDSMYTKLVMDEFPERSWEVGIAKQNMMTMSAGIASCGKIVFVSTYSIFSSMRTCEVLRTFIAHPNLNVKVVSGLQGFSAGIEGVTHLAVEDVGVIRSIPNLTIITPADAVATRKLVREAAEYPGSVYIRLGRDPTPVIFDENYQPKIGKGIILKDYGSDLALVANGFMVREALLSAEILKEQDINVKVAEIHTIKPLDENLILSLTQNTRCVITIEEHNIIGGLGSAVAEVLSENCPTVLKRIGIPDCFTESGTPDELRKKYKLTVEDIVSTAKRIYEKNIKDGAGI